MLLPINYPPSRLTYQLTLTLTVITYKVSLANLLPAITDLTVLDKHQLLCFFIILAIVFETALLGSVTDCGSVDYCTPPNLTRIDRVSQGVAGFMWLCVHVWFVSVAWREHYSPRCVRLIRVRVRVRARVVRVRVRVRARVRVRDYSPRHKTAPLNPNPNPNPNPNLTARPTLPTSSPPGCLRGAA